MYYYENFQGVAVLVETLHRNLMESNLGQVARVCTIACTVDNRQTPQCTMNVRTLDADLLMA